MCGICGKYNFISDIQPSYESIFGMTELITHRGPDDSGIELSGNLGFGFRRLSIQDLSPSGHQPMKDYEGRIMIVFNGEIYNFLELRAELKGYGYKFKSHTDTEVIIYSYEKWGDDFLNKLNGMFGLALWDAPKGKFILARDRIGIKPVYYQETSDGITFGSEIKCILGDTPVSPQYSSSGLFSFLRYRYTPSPDTIYEGIKKLAPGTAITIIKGNVQKWRWWNFKPTTISKGMSQNQAIEELSTLYEDSVKHHLISDVPVGLLLSGGVDSALLLSLMNKEKKGIKTFSVGYGSSFEDDELQDAKKTAELYGAEHHQVILKQKEFIETLPKIISFLEEPVATSSIVPMYHVCQKAGEHVKVALVGQGPDELFGGYNRHLGLRIGPHWRNIPKPARSVLEKNLKGKVKSENFRRALFSLGINDRMNRYKNVFALEETSFIMNLFNKDRIGSVDEMDHIVLWDELKPYIENVDELTGFQFLEMRSSLPDELMMYSDKLSMAHSIELRVPYVDKNIVEYAEGLSQYIKMPNFKRKYIHKAIAKRYLPDEVINRKKRAFASNVIKDWFNSEIDNELINILRDPLAKIYNFLNFASVQEVINAHKNGSDFHKLIFSFIVIEMLMRNWV